MKGCIILFGESFRLGGQFTQNRGSNESYHEQIKACLSHVHFIKKFNMDIFISSYKTKFMNHLIHVYKHNLLGYDFYNELIGQENLIKHALHKICSDNYDFLFIMRIDLFIKPKLIEIFDPYGDKILWPSICFKPFHKCGIHPRVNDVMMFIPKKYYKYLNYIHYHPDGHNQWKYFIENTDLTYDDLDTMMNTYYDSDSSKDLNPIYYIVNRPESTMHHTNEIFNKFNF
jgi:hypothetical protein